MATRAARLLPLSAYVLHRYEWSESSLVLDVFTREQGRIAVAARGARKPFSQLRSVLLPLQRITITVGSGGDDDATREVFALRSAEWAGGASMPRGAALWSGFYANELLMKLLARHDPHPRLFDAYAETVTAISEAADEASTAPALRAFELVMLREIGLLPQLDVETSTQDAVRGEARYSLLADSGVLEVDAALAAAHVATASGALLAEVESLLARRDTASLRQVAAAAGAELRPLLRALVSYHVGDDALRTRRVLRDAQQLLAPNPDR